MAALTEEEKLYYRTATNHQYVAVCDEPNCGKLLPPGELYVVLKSKPRPDKLVFLGAVALKVRCMTCNDLRIGRLKENEDGNILQTKKAQPTAEVVDSQTNIHAGVRRNVLRILKRGTENATTDKLIATIRRKRKYAALKPTVFRKTLRAMRQGGEIRKKAGCWVIKLKKTRKRKIRKETTVAVGSKVTGKTTKSKTLEKKGRR